MKIRVTRSVATEMGDRLATTDMDPNVGAVVSLSG